MFGLGTAQGRKERNLFSNHHHHPEIAKTKLKEVKTSSFEIPTRFLRRIPDVIHTADLAVFVCTVYRCKTRSRRWTCAKTTPGNIHTLPLLCILYDPHTPLAVHVHVHVHCAVYYIWVVQ